jgi:toxin ParE1/3/4
MKDLSFSHRANTDIDAIWDYSAKNWGPDQADDYTDAIRDTCQWLAIGRTHGRRSSVIPDVLRYNCGSHIIYDRDLPDRLEVIRILHSAQDVERHLHD